MDSKSMYEDLWHNVGDWQNQGGAYRHKTPEAEIIKFIEELKQKNITGTVLDIGCGGGRNSIPFAKAGFKVTGIDYSKSAVELAKKLAEENNIEEDQADFKVLDILQEDPCEYDIIIDLGCFHHLLPEQRKEYMKHLHYKKAYFLYCFSINSTKVKGINPSEGNSDIIEDEHYTHFFTKEELDDYFKNYTLQEISMGHSKKFWVLKIVK